MQDEVPKCSSCSKPLSPERLDAQGIDHCSCGERFYLSEGRALTYVDEIPMDEFIGG